MQHAESSVKSWIFERPGLMREDIELDSWRVSSVPVVHAVNAVNAVNVWVLAVLYAAFRLNVV